MGSQTNLVKSSEMLIYPYHKQNQNKINPRDWKMLRIPPQRYQKQEYYNNEDHIVLYLV